MSFFLFGGDISAALNWYFINLQHYILFLKIVKTLCGLTCQNLPRMLKLLQKKLRE